MFKIINITIIIGKLLVSRAWPWLQDDNNQFYFRSFSKPAGRRYSVVKGRSRRSLYTLFKGIPLVFSIRSKVFQLSPAELSDVPSLGELLQRGRISAPSLDE